MNNHPLLVLLAALAVAVPACGDEPAAERPARPAEPAAKTPPEAPPRNDRWKPGGNHTTRPRGAVHDDEIGKDIVGVPRRRILEVFGPPLEQRGRCVYYRVVGWRRGWELCFARGVVDGASGNQRMPR
ncbi:MAG TPA: hypothetical protein VGW10_12495 [Solirubrobacteraceae bacterium]|nr:hypothetical protein [Solirubrobacteraceae bacterium]